MAQDYVAHTFGRLKDVILLIFFVSRLNLCSSVDFNRERFGVTFEANVRQIETISTMSEAKSVWRSYSLGDIKTMLEIVSGKFSKVINPFVGATFADTVPYVANKTYYECGGQARSAEAVALINRDRNKSVLTMLIGVPVLNNPELMEAEVKVALESAQKANQIYPGTVQGIYFQYVYSIQINSAKIALHTMRTHKVEATRLGLKMGSMQNCLGIITAGSEDSPNELQNERNIVNESDFIICGHETASCDLAYGTIFLAMKLFISEVQKLRQINANLEIMGHTSWAIVGSEDIASLEKYWKTINEFVSTHNITFYIREAFDNPWKAWGLGPSKAHKGSWKLKANGKVNSTDGYVEKILGEVVNEKYNLEEGTLLIFWKVYIHSSTSDQIGSSSTQISAQHNRSNALSHVCWHRNISISGVEIVEKEAPTLSGPLLRKFKNSSGWQKLWITFAHSCLYFYKSNLETVLLASLPSLGYKIDLLSEEEKSQVLGKTNVFKLAFKAHVYYFRAESRYTFMRWISVLKNAMIGQVEDVQDVES